MKRIIRLALALSIIFHSSAFAALPIVKRFYSDKFGDGFVQRTSFAGWDDCHDGTSGTANDGSILIRSQAVGFTRRISRAFIPVDLTGEPIGTNLKFTSIYISGFCLGKANDDNDGDDFIVVVGETTQASPTTLEANDYDNCALVHNPIEWSVRKDMGTITVNKSNTWTLTTAGENEVLAQLGSGWWMGGMREGHDVLDNPIASDSNNDVSLNAKVALTIHDPAFPQVM